MKTFNLSHNISPILLNLTLCIEVWNHITITDICVWDSWIPSAKVARSLSSPWVSSYWPGWKLNWELLIKWFLNSFCTAAVVVYRLNFVLFFCDHQMRGHLLKVAVSVMKAGVSQSFWGFVSKAWLKGRLWTQPLSSVLRARDHSWRWCRWGLHARRVPTFTSAGPGFAEDVVLGARTGAVDRGGGWSAVGVFKNSGTAGDTGVNWWKRQKGDKSVKSLTVKTEKLEKKQKKNIVLCLRPRWWNNLLYIHWANDLVFALTATKS